MTAAPQPGPAAGQAQAAPGPAGPQAAVEGAPARPGAQAAAPRTATVGTNARATGSVGARGSRRLIDTSSTPRRLRLARGLAAAACLVPGIVGMVEIASAATAPVSSPTQTYGELRAGAAAYEAKAMAAAATGQSSKDADLALAKVQTQIGSAALLYPDRASELYQVGDQLAARQTQLTSSVVGRTGTAAAAVPAPSADLTAALAKLENPPAARSLVNSQHVIIGGVLGAVGLLAASVWLARTTKRIVNPGLAAGLLLTVGVTALGYQVLASTGTSTAVGDIATLRAEAAQSVAAEAGSLSSATPDGAALRSQARDHLTTGSDLVDRSSASWTTAAAAPWGTFTSKELTEAQLTGGSVATRQGLVSGRIGDLATVDSALASLARQNGAGADSRPNAWAGYGLFALSLVAGAAAWTGVGRRVSEYQ